MDDMVSMKKRRMVVDGVGGVAPGDGGGYPYGLKIRLEREQIVALGMSEKELPEIGEQMLIKAMVEVTDISKEGTEEEPELHLGLQITDMLVKKEKEEKPKEEAEKAEKVNSKNMEDMIYE